MEELLNISPIDGRYKKITKELNNYFSEYALIKYRAIIEIKWLLWLIEKEIIDVKLTNQEKKSLINIINNFQIEDAIQVKEIENTTKHDVKAIEYFLREKLKILKLEKLFPFIHFALTSEDINNVSYNLMIKDALNNIYSPTLNSFLNQLNNLSNEYKSISMLSHTHGQPATPTTVGKELKVFAYRIQSILNYLQTIKLKSKFKD